MTQSTNEIQMLVYKACRGAGVPLGQCEDIARAVAGDPGCVSDLITHLGYDPSGVMDVRHDPCELRNANILRDFASAADAAEFGPVRICGVSLDGVVRTLAAFYGVVAEADNDDIILKPNENSCPRHARCDVDASDLAALGTFAARTYVPETDASRLGGAGAGLNDND